MFPPAQTTHGLSVTTGPEQTDLLGLMGPQGEEQLRAGVLAHHPANEGRTVTGTLGSEGDRTWGSDALTEGQTKGTLVFPSSLVLPCPSWACGSRSRLRVRVEYDLEGSPWEQVTGTW